MSPRRGVLLQKIALRSCLANSGNEQASRERGDNPSPLHDTFAVRYLQAEGDLFTLREWLGQEESATVKRYLRMSDERMKSEKRKER
ncbi:MAG TPA: hypothetical protein VFB12_20580 [Ktedonobacteraceae bacterium]|nr:hypothetical protein [Ktedonobacteraceae bacterium]